MNVQLVITLDGQTGQVSVSGPIEDKILSYGLLDIARDVIAEHGRAKVQKNGIVPVRMQLPGKN